MKLPHLALPDEGLRGAFRDSRAGNEDQRNECDNDERDADGEDEKEVGWNEFMFGERVSIMFVSFLQKVRHGKLREDSIEAVLMTIVIVVVGI